MSEKRVAIVTGGTRGMGKAIALELAGRIAALAPQAARLNKRTLRDVAAAAQALDTRGAYDWAASAEHIEGIQAFLQKRTPHF